MLTTPGTISIVGAGFAPKAAIFGAVPTVDANYTTPWTGLNYGTNGDENTAFGFATNSGGILKQAGACFFDKAGYDANGAKIVVNGHENDSTAMHDGSYLSYTDAVIKSQTRTGFQTFSKASEAAITRFLPNGVELSQSQSTGRAGKIAYLLLGDVS
jgi:hypothetical protein